MKARARLSLIAVMAVLALFWIAAFFVPSGPHDPAKKLPVGHILGPTHVSGRVEDAGGPVAGAHVRFAGQPDFVVTDGKGQFILRRPEKGSVTITAWKEGYFIGRADDTTDSVTIKLISLPAKDNEQYHWVSPLHSDWSESRSPTEFRCSKCHETIDDEWSKTGHAASFSSDTFRNLFDGTDSRNRSKVGWSLKDERPEGTLVCASCHSPTKENLVLAEPGDGGWESDWGPGVAARRKLTGVHCDYCHKVVGPAEGTVGLTHGRFGLKLLRPAADQLFFGPHEDTTADTSFSAFQKQSRLCASCHEGVVFGVRVYETYSEWQASPAGKMGTQCQDCHMKPTGKMSNMAPDHGGAKRDPNTLANHTFFDGSQRNMLKQCLDLNLNLSHKGDQIQAKVEIAVSGVGHRVPTGLPDRNLALVVEAFDADGRPVSATGGATLPPFMGPELKGKSGKLFAKVLKDWEGKSPVPFWRAAPDFDDSRLTPGQTERLEFAFPQSAVSIRARLIYRKFWPEVIKQKGWLDYSWVVADKTQTVK